jgi:hypothetical protein
MPVLLREGAVLTLRFAHAPVYVVTNRSGRVLAVYRSLAQAKAEHGHDKALVISKRKVRMRYLGAWL